MLKLQIHCKMELVHQWSQLKLLGSGHIMSFFKSGINGRIIRNKYCCRLSDKPSDNSLAGSSQKLLQMKQELNLSAHESRHVTTPGFSQENSKTWYFFRFGTALNAANVSCHVTALQSATSSGIAHGVRQNIFLNTPTP